MLNTLRRLLGTVPNPGLGAVFARLEALESAETLRAAEHAAVLDRLERLYKRVSVRIAREGAATLPNGSESIVEHPDSVLAMRTRRGRHGTL